MLGIHDFWLFVAAGLVLNVTPGPDTFYILGRSVSQGRAAGLLSALAITTGCLFHSTAAALGLSAILARSAMAFQIVRYTGAAYLVFLGFRIIFSGATELDGTTRSPARQNLWVIYRQGVITNVLNPKVALFFLAFLPQFIDPKTPTRVSAFLLLGAVFMFNGTLWCLLLAWFAGSVSQKVRDNPRAQIAMKRGTGALFIGLGTKLAVDR